MTKTDILHILFIYEPCDCGHVTCLWYLKQENHRSTTTQVPEQEAVSGLTAHAFDPSSGEAGAD